MLDGNIAGVVPDPVDDVLAEPARLLLWMRCDDDLVDRRLELRERVADRSHGICLHDEPMGRDAFVPEHAECAVQPPPCRGAAGVLVDDITTLGLVDGGDHGHAQVAVFLVPLDRFDQLAAGDRLVGDNEQMHQCTGTSSSAAAAVRSPFNTAWRAPGTPYSYGLPTTCGISSKLKTGGGEETCHSRVSARQGFAAAGLPRRMLITML